MAHGTTDVCMEVGMDVFELEGGGALGWRGCSSAEAKAEARHWD